MALTLDGTTGASLVLDGTITAAKLSGAQTGSAPAYAGRAWVNFNGTGTVAIRASGNVSSITDNGVADYTVNFTTAMSDANYSANVTNNSTAGDSTDYKIKAAGFGSAPTLMTTTQLTIAGPQDSFTLCVIIDR